MSLTLNKVQIIGHLGKDPEIRTFQSGDKCANFSVATSEQWTDKSTGEKKEKTEWHQVAVLNQNIVKFVEKYLKKGMKVYVEGQLQTRKWTDQSGQDRYTTEIVLKFNAQLIALSQLERQDQQRDAYDEHHSRPAESAYSNTQVDALADDIPF